MEKRLIIAVVLSLLVLMGWRQMSVKMYPVVQEEVVENKDAVRSERTPLATNRAVKAQVAPVVNQEYAEEKVLIDQQDYTIKLPSASIREVVFRDYQDSLFLVHDTLLYKEGNQEVPFREEYVGTDSRFVYEDKEKRIIKDLRFHNSPYTIELRLIVENKKPTRLQINPSVILAKLDQKSTGSNARFQHLEHLILVKARETLWRNPRRKFQSSDNYSFIGVRERYFCALMQPETKGFDTFVNKLDSQVEIGVSYQMALEPSAREELNFLIYLGPQELDSLYSGNPEWQKVVYYGKLDGISKFMLKILRAMYQIVHNWGLALILLSLGLSLLFYPLTVKQLQSMKKMQALQPKIEELRDLYKNNPQRLNKETMELYRQEKVNPVGGCLPLLLQMPIFVSLYQALLRSFELKGANFLWIKDLSEPDRLFVLGHKLPMIGNEINLLPILMMAVMFFQQKVSQSGNSGPAAEQQRIMTIVFPLIFGVIFYHMPSGLVLYWFLNSLLMFINQSRLKLKQ